MIKIYKFQKQNFNVSGCEIQNVNVIGLAVVSQLKSDGEQRKQQAIENTWLSCDLNYKITMPTMLWSIKISLLNSFKAN